MSKGRFVVKILLLSIGCFLFWDLLVFPSSALRDAGRMSVPETEKVDHELAYVMEILSSYRTGLSAIEELRLAEVILEESRNYNIDPLFVLALIRTESTFYNWSRSRQGAMGLMQIRPGTGKVLAKELDLKWDGVETLFDPYTNVKLGVHYLSILRERFGDDLKKILAAYNYGPSYLKRRIRKGKRLPRRYANAVLANYEALKKGAWFD